MRLLTAVRLLSLGLFLYHTVSVRLSWMAVVTGAFLAVTLYGFVDRKAAPLSPRRNENPLKGKPTGVTESDISPELKAEIAGQISDMVTYDATDCECLSQFTVIQLQTECIFAKKAKLWGSASWDNKLDIEGNIYRCLPTLLKFVHLCPLLGLDGFVFMLPGHYGANIQKLGDAVRRVLTMISDHDPAGVRCMDKAYIGRRGWVFQFNRCTMFVTTFAPCYSSNHSRYAFGSDNCFVLLQPELSFAQHDLCEDTPHTNWDQPRTARDHIRVAFRDAGRPYEIRDTIYYPMAEDIVKPIESGDGSIDWWKKGV